MEIFLVTKIYNMQINTCVRRLPSHYLIYISVLIHATGTFSLQCIFLKLWACSVSTQPMEAQRHALNIPHFLFQRQRSADEATWSRGPAAPWSRGHADQLSFCYYSNEHISLCSSVAASERVPYCFPWLARSLVSRPDITSSRVGGTVAI